MVIFTINIPTDWCWYHCTPVVYLCHSYETTSQAWNELIPATYFPPLSKHLPRCFKTLTYHQTYNYTLHTHFTQLYIVGNFPYWTDVVRISGGEWGPTRPSHHLNLFPIYVGFFCHFSQSKQSLTKCNVFFPISKCPASSCTPLKVNKVKCNWLL